MDAERFCRLVRLNVQQPPSYVDPQEAFKVLGFLIEHADELGHVAIQPKIIADHLDLAPTGRLSHIVTYLERLGYVYRTGKTLHARYNLQADFFATLPEGRYRRASARAISAITVTES